MDLKDLMPKTENGMIGVIACVVLLIFGTLMAWPQQQAKKYEPTEVQGLRLQVAQRDAWLAQRDYLDAQRRYQEAVRDLNALGEEIRKENGWPSGVIFNADRAEFTEPPPNTARPGAPK